MDSPQDASPDRPAKGWWERRFLLLAVILLSAVPLLWPALPPLIDLPGHMARWHISMAIGGSPALAHYYGFTWQLIGNLGLDLLVPPLASLIGLEPATKLAVLLIPPLTAAGMLWIAFEAHRRIPPTAFLALPFAYAWPFQYGFVNFALAQALAFCAFGLWLRLGRSGRLGLRAVLFAPIACLLWITHSFGWGLFGLLAFGAELARRREAGDGWRPAIMGAIVQCLSLVLPLVFMLLHPMQTARGNSTGDWFDMPTKLLWVISVLRDRWMWFDIVSLLPPVMVIYFAARDRRFGFVALLGWPALLCLAAFLLLPRLLLGGAYVDMRMVPAVLVLGLLAIRPPANAPRLARLLAVVAIGFFVMRTAAMTLSFVERAAEQQHELGAVAVLPRGAAVLALVSRPCNGAWVDPRRDHLPALAIVRRDAFVNSQWDIEGQQLLHVRYRAAAPYTADPSQLVYPARCASAGSDFARAIADFPRGAFTHVWTIGFPPGAAKARDLRLVWSNGGSALYRVMR
jgi:hypothetical protein